MIRSILNAYCGNEPIGVDYFSMGWYPPVMRAFLPLALLSVGCAGTWDTITSRKFRQDPVAAVWPKDEPLVVLRTSQEGDERAKAMRRLKEPLRNGGTSEAQDEAIQLLGEAAVGDPSPVVRIAAIDALGRFQDERVSNILTAAFANGDGVPPVQPRPARKSLDPDDPRVLAERFSLRGPVGFSEEVSSAIRSRAITALANTGRSDALPLVARTARGETEFAVDRDTQLAAVRGLARLRTPESIQTCVAVLKAEKGKDPALSTRARESLVSLTGKDYPAEPQAWETAVAAGTVTVVAEPTMIQQVGGWFNR